MSSGGTDRCVALLADRYPLLLQDIQIWRQANPTVRVPFEERVSPCYQVSGANDYLFNATEAWPARQRLAELPPGRKVVQMFHSVPQFLLFLGSPGAAECIQSDAWRPWIMVPGMEHGEVLCRSEPPRDWPWGLWRGALPEPPAREATRFIGGGLGALLDLVSRELVNRIGSAYADRPDPGVILRAGERPLRVLSAAVRRTSYQCYCARDIAAALAANGVETRVVLLEQTPAKSHDLLVEIQAFDPDVLFINGETRGQYPGLPDGLCVITWDQDYGVCWHAQYTQTRAVQDRLLVMLEEWRQDALSSGVPAERVLHLNLGTNQEIYHSSGRAPTPTYDVLFVGNIYPWERYKEAIQFGRLKVELQQVFEHGRLKLRDWVLSRGEDEPFVLPDLGGFLAECSAELGLTGRTTHWSSRQDTLYFRYRVAHFVLRELYVSALADFRLGLFGNGWTEFPAVARQARPAVENGPLLLERIRSAAINLHLHTWTVHHPRLYDTAAAGGFLLVGRVAEMHPLDEVFEPGKELDTFGSIAELKRKVRYYLDHPVERMEMARRASERALRDHTMARRMSYLLEALKSHEPFDTSSKAHAECHVVAGCAR